MIITVNHVKQNDVCLETSNLSKPHETRQPSSSSSQVVLVYLHPFRRNSLLKSASQPQIAKKIGGRGFEVI